MELENHTGAVASLHAADLLEPELRAVVIVKKTYALGADGRLSETDDPLPLVPDQLITEFGHFHGELFFRKNSVDLCVLGTAHLPSTTPRTEVRIEWPGGSNTLRLTGDRVWQKTRSGDLIPSAPVPFREMPLGYARAYGGVTEVEGEDVPWPDNPGGRGYYEAPEKALGAPLPNIEAAGRHAPVHWSVRVPVAGWGPYPMYWGLRASRALKIDPKDGRLLDVSPELFNHAHPALIVDRLDPGSCVRLLGVRPEAVEVPVPQERPLVRALLGATVTEAAGELDGFFIWLDAARVVVTWRARFRYAVRPEELRRAHLQFTPT